MIVVGRLVDLVDALSTGRPPRVIERQFSWLRTMGYRVAESGWRGMELYATYASRHVVVRVVEEYHYGVVGVWLARARPEHPDRVGPDVAIERLLARRAPEVRWDGDYDTSVRGAGEAKLAEAARLLRQHFADVARGENLEVLDSQAHRLADRRDPGP